MKSKDRLIILLFFVVFFYSLFFTDARASSYDIYVDSSYSGDDSDGSSDKPYKKIEKAIEESGSKGNKIFIKNGTYEEQLTLSGGVELTGEDKSKTIIKGAVGATTITSKGTNNFKNLTVSGGAFGIIFEKKGSVDKCIVKNASRNAISLSEGSGTVTIKNSDIKDNGKGVYAQKGSSFNISGNNFEKNKGEGIDIRDKVDGSITGNIIANNGEGGIEIVVGGSNVSIKNNTIKKNNASGIAAQFYSFASKTGEINISKNNISYNGIYGIICKNPSGGDPKEGFFDKSLELKDNKIEHNKRKSISGSCDIVKAVSEEEKKSNQAIESESAKKDIEDKVEEVKENDPAEEERARKLLEEENRLKTRLEEAIIQKNDFYDIISSIEKNIENEGKVKTFILGPSYKDIKKAKEEIGSLSKVKDGLIEVSQGFEEIGNLDSKTQVENVIGEIENEINLRSEMILNQESKFGFYAWIFKLKYGQITFFDLIKSYSTFSFPHL